MAPPPPVPPPLAPQIAGLTAGLRAESAALADRYGTIPARLVAAVHAMLLAALARLMDRLEQLLLLWQSGQLPQPAARPVIASTTPPTKFNPISPTRTKSSRTLHTRSPPGATPPAPNPPIQTPPSGTRRERPGPASAPIPCHATIPPPPTRHARAPPRKTTPRAPRRRTPLLFRYNN